MKAHVFFYAFPLIQEGLNYQEHDIKEPWNLDEIPGRPGSFVFCDRHWYVFLKESRWPKKVYDTQVPKPIRALALICVIN